MTPRFNAEKSQHKRLVPIHNTQSMLKPLYLKNSYIQNVELPYHRLLLQLSTLGEKIEICLPYAMTLTIISDKNSRSHHNLLQTVLTLLYHLHGSETDTKQILLLVSLVFFFKFIYFLILYPKTFYNNLSGSNNDSPIQCREQPT